MAPSPKVLNLIAVMTESILVGAYAVLAVVVVWLLIARRRTMPSMHKGLFWASIVMFLISVAHLGLVVQQISVVKISLANSRARIILAAVQFILGDIVLIWRVWVVWGRNYWVALGPFIMMIIAAGFVINTAAHIEQKPGFFTVAPTALIVANTAICTLLIAGRIWYARYQVRKLSGNTIHASGFSKAVILFIETGALITAAQFTSLILNHVNSPGIHILLDFEIPLIGILPTLIIVLVHFELVGGPPKSHSSQSRTMRFEARSPSHVTQLDTFVTSTAHSSEVAGSVPNQKGFGIV